MEKTVYECVEQQLSYLYNIFFFFANNIISNYINVGLSRIWAQKVVFTDAMRNARQMNNIFCRRIIDPLKLKCPYCLLEVFFILRWNRNSTVPQVLDYLKAYMKLTYAGVSKS